MNPPLLRVVEGGSQSTSNVQAASLAGPLSQAELEQLVLLSDKYHRANMIGTRSGGGNVSDVTKDELRLSVEASEARTDAKFARLDGKIDLLIGKVDALNIRIDDVRADGRSTRANIWVVAFGLAALIVAALVGFPSIFNMGTQLRGMVQKEVQMVLPSLPRQ